MIERSQASMVAEGVLYLNVSVFVFVIFIVFVIVFWSHRVSSLL